MTPRLDHPPYQEADAFALLDEGGRIITVSNGLPDLLGCSIPPHCFQGHALGAVLAEVLAIPDAVEINQWLTSARQPHMLGNPQPIEDLRVQWPGSNGDILILNAQPAPDVRMFVRIQRRAEVSDPRAPENVHLSKQTTLGEMARVPRARN